MQQPRSLPLRKVFTQMSEVMRSGMILARQGALLPCSVRLEKAPYVRGWSIIAADNPFLLDKAIRASGWSFFFLAGEIKCIALGRPTAANFRKAITRGLGRVPRQFNSAEVATVAGKHFLGVPYVIARVYSRHIQEHLYLLSVAERARNAPPHDQLAA